MLTINCFYKVRNFKIIYISILYIVLSAACFILRCKCKKCFNITNIIDNWKLFLLYQVSPLILFQFTINLFTHSIPIYLFQLCFTTALHLCPACLSLKSFHAHFQFDEEMVTMVPAAVQTLISPPRTNPWCVCVWKTPCVHSWFHVRHYCKMTSSRLSPWYQIKKRL